MLVKTIFCGFGGQGVLMMGYSLAHGGMNAGFNVTYLPSYGAEVRGGTANCTVVVSDEEIASPISSNPENIVVLNTPSLYAFQNRTAPGGSIFLNSSIIAVESSRQDVRVYKIPTAELADKLGDKRMANTVMMGALMKATGLVSPDIFLKSIETVMGSKKKEVVAMNRRAFEVGYDFLQ
ncbi:MAG: 2-oxoacid:acceptor oxidoreductase family protein [Syntrophales bacterium]|jgi:2-oxoglutarate ferredoxin oxidoreductase subunit gamma|nr:2-oxoacid:acceptor oxidoreductase family protein [Syntrophales bacterium]